MKIPGRPLPDWARRYQAVIDLCTTDANYYRKVRAAWTTAQRLELIETARTIQPALPGVIITKSEPPPLPLFS
jgi:hypothetical protein